MSALSDYLSTFNLTTPPLTYFAGVLNVISGPPDINTSPFFIFTWDQTNDKVYINTDRTPGSWVEVADAGAIPGDTFLTATT